MDKLIINGPAKLRGLVEVSSSKNASLPIMAAVLLNSQEVELRELPGLKDVQTMVELLEDLGVKVRKEGRSTFFRADHLSSLEATYDLVKTMRASILVLGPLLARFKKAKVSLPGGCAIGARPIDIHLKGLEKMGAKIELEAGYVKAETDGLKGAHILLPFPSVGATENLMMAAVLAQGESRIENAAKEPEIVDLANFLISMGAKIKGAGTHDIYIEGPTELKSTSYKVIGDRIEAVTYVIAGIITGSEVLVKGIDPKIIEAVLDVLKSMGAKIETGPDFIQVRPHEKLNGVNVDTAPYPGYPTDAQAQLMALATVADSSSVITEHIFENRFMHVSELIRMGAKLTLKGSSTIVEGKSKLTGAPVMCTDLRASAALVLAALAATGESEIQRVYHLDRGYEKIDEKLRALGAQVKRVRE